MSDTPTPRTDAAFKRFCQNGGAHSICEESQKLERELAAANAALADRAKLAPVQGYAAGIPWSMHLRAYDAYCKRWSPQQALITGGCRGGFHTDELDMLIPYWRDELSELSQLKADLATRTQTEAGLREQVRVLRDAILSGEWPLLDVLAKLSEAVRHLREVHSCDTDGHEQFYRALYEAETVLPLKIQKALALVEVGATEIKK